MATNQVIKFITHMLAIILCAIGLVLSANLTAQAQTHEQDKRVEHITLRIAVASSFTPILARLANDFSQQHKVTIETISASSGTLYQQIVYGAPFDLFLSADDLRPEKLAEQQLISPESLATYAQGQLVLFGLSQKPLDYAFLANYRGRIAIANPKTAPYGKAAMQVIESLAIGEQLTLITGQNVAQTYQQVITQGVPIGLVSLGQLMINKQSGYVIPQRLYQPILQKMVIPKQSKQPQLAREFQQFLLSEQTQRQLTQLGFTAVSAQGDD
ncbi:molybdate ABC transporter substrate-binding protein [Thalassotalea sp. LPB0316]|uniref:molybdate ABC transporter substrate-binding protein n=1 Tax=Thalassotalea sp. LPB0316 TaxID=2769490 RepID=UPI001867B6AA|nr:molybdate ABC transporter substrate-binding protein [Thalassotalea sp. LPB0316]QOL25740.1 molybdate ABC transporter substrate-binding protein [Thalassotalea sp. LPB0316]